MTPGGRGGGYMEGKKGGGRISSQGVRELDLKMGIRVGQFHSPDFLDKRGIDSAFGQRNFLETSMFINSMIKKWEKMHALIST